MFSCMCVPVRVRTYESIHVHNINHVYIVTAHNNTIACKHSQYCTVRNEQPLYENQLFLPRTFRILQYSASHKRKARQTDKLLDTILHYIIRYYTILYYTILYYTILYYTILYYTILYYTILYYTILY